MKIISDKRLSHFDPVNNVMMFGCGSRCYRGREVEDHLVTLDNGISVHVGLDPGRDATMDDVLNMALRKTLQSDGDLCELSKLNEHIATRSS